MITTVIGHQGGGGFANQLIKISLDQLKSSLLAWNATADVSVPVRGQGTSRKVG